MAAELLAFTVIELLPVVGLGENVAVTPLGKPDAERVMLRAKQADSVGVMATVPLLPAAIDRLGGEDVSEKLSDIAPITVSAMVEVAVSEPETPVMVIVDVPMLAAQPAVSVRTLPPVTGLAPKTAVTPLGRPDTASVTLPVNGLMSVTVMVSALPLPPSAIARADTEGLSVKPPSVLVTTVRAMVVDTVVQPEVPAIVTVNLPGVAVLLAVSVSTLLALMGLVLQDAFTPPGRPVAASVTLPVNPAMTAVEMVSVTLLP